MVKVLILLASGVEEMEAVILADVLRRAGAEVRLLGLDGEGFVKGSREIRIGTEGELTGEEEADLLVLPGGTQGARKLSKDDRVLGMVRRFFEEDRWVAALCAAPVVLAEAGVLEGRTVTSHPSVRKKVEPRAGTYSGNAVEIDGKLVTGQGPGVAFDFALDLVGLLLGPQKAAEVKRPMCFSG